MLCIPSWLIHKLNMILSDILRCNPRYLNIPILCLTKFQKHNWPLQSCCVDSFPSNGDVSFQIIIKLPKRKPNGWKKDSHAQCVRKVMKLFSQNHKNINVTFFATWDCRWFLLFWKLFHKYYNITLFEDCLQTAN